MRHRRERLNDLLLSFMAEEIRRLRDPRLESVTVTGVEAAPDCRTAKVYWSSPGKLVGESGAIEFPSEPDVAGIQDALKGAEGLLRKRISDELNLRHTPKLSFKHDSSAATGSRIDELLRKAGL